MFRTPACFELSWPMKTESRFLSKPKGRKRVSFVHMDRFHEFYVSFLLRLVNHLWPLTSSWLQFSWVLLWKLSLILLFFILDGIW